MTHFISNPSDPDDVVQEEPDEYEICKRCEEEITGGIVVIDDEIYCQNCADHLDAAAENEFDRQKDAGESEEEK